MHFLYRHKQKPVVCPICGKLSPNKKALTVHKRIHREDYKERFKCPICEKGFRDRTKLRVNNNSNMMLKKCLNQTIHLSPYFRNIRIRIPVYQMHIVAIIVRELSGMAQIYRSIARKCIRLKKIYGRHQIISVLFEHLT